MKKFMNNPENFEKEMLEGILYASESQLSSLRDDNRSLVRKDVKEKVGILTGGGSGHLPLFLGYVGEGLLDGVAVGDIFQSPSPKQIYEVIKHINCGKGVLSIFGNYGGDVLNFEIANELAEEDDIQTATIIVNDDVASMKKEESEKRRGVAGMFFVYKAAGAAAELGQSLENVTKVAEKANANVRTMGVGLSPCIIPIKGKPSFEIPEGEMEIGIGIHGEPGIYRGEQTSLQSIVNQILNSIDEDLEMTTGNRVSVLVNGLGATPLEELYIAYKHIREYYNDKNINIVQNFIGEYATSMEMVGFSISVIKLDNELESLLKQPHHTPFLKYFGE